MGQKLVGFWMASNLPPEAEVFIGDLTRPDSLVDAAAGIDAILFTHGSDGAGNVALRTLITAESGMCCALGSQKVRIALMTAIGVTDRLGSYNRSTEAHDWKRRGERLVRASGLPYTIVRPGWFDYNKPDEHKLVFLQGDTRHAGNPSDGVIARQQIAQVLLASLTSDAALRKTFELVATKGSAQSGLDGVRDVSNMPLEDEPKRVRDDMDAIQAASQDRK
ncbi:MAG: NAD(P)H-binding protein [Bryobacteraceae bacterium]